MSKIVDITDKLSFDENTVIKIKDTEIEINTDAQTVIKVMGLFRDGEKNEMEASLEAAGLVIGKEGMEKIEKMKLNFKDFIEVIRQAVNIATGTEDDDEGEDQTHTTT